MPQQTFRFAQKSDTALILSFIRQLADYERMLGEVVATEELLGHWLFEKHAAEVLFVCDHGKEVGFALFFHNFSTFVGRKGLYLEDLFIIPEKRGRGYGKALLKYLARTAVERNCGRMEWICLDWNQPALDVYSSIGAVPMDEWTVQRLSETALKQFADNEIN
jgi:GNAT superfamily N-acetyltransferase